MMRVGFSVGNRVVIARGPMARPGTVGTVWRVHDSGVVNVQFSPEESCNAWWTDLSYAPAEERPPCVGDRVRVIPGENGYRLDPRCGQVGAVVKDGPHVYTVRFPDGSTANYIGELLKVLSREAGDTEQAAMYSTAMEDRLHQVRTKCAELYCRMRKAEDQRDDLARILKDDKPATEAFKEGDRVRFIRDGSAYLGREGRVSDVFSSGRILVTVEPGRVGTFLPDELESAGWRDDEIRELRDQVARLKKSDNWCGDKIDQLVDELNDARETIATLNKRDVEHQEVRDRLQAQVDNLRADLTKANTERLLAACNTRRIQKILDEE